MARVTVGTVSVGAEGKRLVAEVLDSNRLSSGKYVSLFERKFADYHGLKASVAVGTGTDADTLALATLLDFGAKPGQEVITPALDFIAPANSIIHSRLKPVFVDVDAETANISPELIEKKITKNTAAIMPVHLMGRPCRMDEIMEIAEKHGIPVIEDAAEAHGAQFKGKKVGTFGAMAAFSFYVAHIITTGEGGAVITNNEDYAAVLRSLRAHGRACKCKVCTMNLASSYCPLRFSHGEDIDTRFFFERIGYSCKMTEMSAALGIEQIGMLDAIVEARRKNMAYLNKVLAPYSGFFQLFKEGTDERISPLAYPLIIKQGAPFKRKDIVRHLENSGIETRPFFSSIPTQQPAYCKSGSKLGDFPNSEFIGLNGFYVGCHQNLTTADLDLIASAIGSFIKKSKGV